MFSLASLPYPVAHFLGYRRPDQKPRKALPQWRVCLWSFLGAWFGIAILEIVFAYSPAFVKAPIIVGSFGASAVLLYGAIDAPLAQPRNAFCGQVIGAICGVVIAQLFTQVPKHWASEDQALVVKWVAGATAMALSLVVMQVTKTIHPPGGATAVIAVTQNEATALGWLYIAVVVVSVTLHIAIACIVNNIEKRYPIYWWTPKLPPLNHNNPETALTAVPSLENLQEEHIGMTKDKKDGRSMKGNLTASRQVNVDLAALDHQVCTEGLPMIVVTPERLITPTSDILTAEEIDLLKRLQSRL